MGMTRGSETLSIDIGTSAANSDPILKGSYAGGSIELPSGSSTATINVYADLGSGYHQAEDEDGANITMKNLSAETPRAIPTSAWNFPRIKLVASSNATSSVPVWLTS